MEQKIEQYEQLDPNWGNSREEELINSCLEGQREGSAEDLSTACAKFDEVSKLDSWKTQLLLRAKKGIENADDDLL